MQPTSITIYILKVNGIADPHRPYYATHELAKRAAVGQANLLAEDLHEEYDSSFVEHVSDSIIDVCWVRDEFPVCYARVHIETAALVVDYQNTLDA